MTRDEIKEIVARELYVQDHAGKLRSDLWSRQERRLHARREWYVRTSEKTRDRWRVAADVLIRSLAKSEIDVVARSDAGLPADGETP